MYISARPSFKNVQNCPDFPAKHVQYVYPLHTQDAMYADAPHTPYAMYRQSTTHARCDVMQTPQLRQLPADGQCIVDGWRMNLPLYRGNRSHVLQKNVARYGRAIKSN